MPTDTRTVAELEAAGFTHIEARCCNITAVSLVALKNEDKITDTTTFAEIVGRMRCQRCGKPPQTFRPWFLYIDNPPPPGGPAKTGGMMPPDGVKPRKPAG